MRNFIMGAMGMMGTMGMMSKRTEGQQHCCCMADSFSLDHATQLLGIPAGLLLCEAKASVVANRAPIPHGG